MRIACLLSIVMGLWAAQAQAGEARHFDVRKEPAFSQYRAAIDGLLQHTRHQPVNDFCVLGQVADDGSLSSWVLWQQGRAIILWDGSGSPLRQSRRRLNLDTDVVDSESDLQGSSYRVTRAWVAQLTQDCQREGVQVHIGQRPKK